MTNSKKDLFIFIGVSILLIFLFLKAKPILMPFITSLILSYFLNPVVSKLKKKYDITRTASSIFILLAFYLILLSALFVLLPIIYKQFLEFASLVPLYFEVVVGSFYPKILDFINNLGFKIDTDAASLFARENLADNAINLSHNFANNLISSTLNIVNIFSIIFIVPILVFYILKDWDTLITTMQKHLPKAWAQDIKELSSNIDKTLSSYLRGQFNVCLILGTFYAVGLSLSGLKFGFIIGLLTGFFSFVPYIGMLIGVIIALIVGIFQWGFDLVNYSIVGTIFIVGQLVEGNFLTPRLIGSKIGVHDVWVIFGIFFFGAWLGFIGVFLAVPLTAVISTITKFFLAKYRKKYT